MAIFGIGEKKKKVREVRKLTPASDTTTVTLSGILPFLKPRITEKSSLLAEASVYVFEIERSIGKKQVARAFEATYNVTPEKIRIVNLPKKHIIARGKRGTRGGAKKAYVYLTKGTKIEL